MSLAPGTRFGPYDVLAPIGAGGMGEVYRGRDTRLNRDVALKVLPAAFASDTDRLQRFARELAYVETHPVTGNDIWVVELEPNRTPTRVLATPADESHPAFSPNGKWLLYVSDEYLYVRPFPGPGRETRITRTRATAPIWASDGRSIWFVDTSGAIGEQQIMRLPWTRAALAWWSAIPRCSPPARSAGPHPPGADVTPDGKRLLVTLWRRPPQPGATQPAVLQLIVHADLSGGVHLERR